MHLYCFKDLGLYQLHKLKIILLKLLVLHQYKTDPNLTIQAFSGENVCPSTRGRLFSFLGLFCCCSDCWRRQLLGLSSINLSVYHFYLFICLFLSHPSISLAFIITIGFAWHLQGDSSWISAYHASIYVYNVAFKYRNNAMLYWRRLHPPNICLGEIGG